MLGSLYIYIAQSHTYNSFTDYFTFIANPMPFTDFIHAHSYILPWLACLFKNLHRKYCTNLQLRQPAQCIYTDTQNIVPWFCCDVYMSNSSSKSHAHVYVVSSCTRQDIQIVKGNDTNWQHIVYANNVHCAIVTSTHLIVVDSFTPSIAHILTPPLPGS